MKVREIMTEEVAKAAPDTTLEEIAAIMRNEDTGAVPVLDDGELMGLITDRDIVIRCIADGKDASEITAYEIISDDLETIGADADVEEALRLMSQKQIRRLPVVEDGTLVGIISLGDIAVKSGDDQAADTLEDVSQGVKTKSSRQGRQEQQRREPERRAGFTTQQRLDQERGAGRPVSGGRNAKQGIANRGAGEEQRRQSRVVPIRNQGKTTRKRRAS
jgi:CBS domain-containing protein